MPYSIDKKLVVAVSSSAVFDMTEADKVFKTQGNEAYRQYQVERVDSPFAPGVAFPFIKRLLRLNDLHPQEQPIEVVVISRNDPDSGRRFFRSCQHHQLNITRGAFLTGRPPYLFIPAYNASLFLSANETDVVDAIAANLPAGLVLPTAAKDDANDPELRIAFDFDGVLSDDEAEIVYQESHNLELFHAAEVKKMTTPHKPGPLKDLLTKISYFQRIEAKKEKLDPNYRAALRIAIVTARSAPANERFVTTLNSWGISAAEVFFMGGIEKRRVLEVLKPHIFFDDQLAHLTPTASQIPSVHIPFGVVNKKSTLKPAKGRAQVSVDKEPIS